MIVPAGPGSSVLSGPSRGRSLAGSGSPGRPAYFSLLVQWHLDRGQLPVMVRPCSRGISVHTPVNLSAGVTQAPGTALSGKGPCVGLLKPKVKRRHWWFHWQNADALTL